MPPSRSGVNQLFQVSERKTALISISKEILTVASRLNQLLGHKTITLYWPHSLLVLKAFLWISAHLTYTLVEKCQLALLNGDFQMCTEYAQEN